MGFFLNLVLPYCDQPKEYYDENPSECSPLYYWPFIICFGFYKIISLATTFACIPMVVESSILSTAFGAITAISNIVLFTFNKTLPAIMEKTP